MNFIVRGNKWRRYCRHRDRGVRRVRSLRWPGADAQEQGLGRQEAGAQSALKRGRGRLHTFDIIFQHVIQLQLRGCEIKLAIVFTRYHRSSFLYVLLLYKITRYVFNLHF